MILRKFPRYLAISAVVIFLAFALYYFFSPEGSSMSGSQTQKAVEKILGRDINGGQPQASSGIYKGKYLSFRYPATAKPYTYNHENILKQPGVLESFQFESTTPKYFFNVQVSDASVAASLDELSGVGMREANSAVYKKSDNKEGLIFVKDNIDGAEMSEFKKIGERYYMFIISGGNLSEMKEVFDKVLSSSSYN